MLSERLGDLSHAARSPERIIGDMQCNHNLEGATRPTSK